MEMKQKGFENNFFYLIETLIMASIPKISKVIKLEQMFNEEEATNLGESSNVNIMIQFKEENLAFSINKMEFDTNDNIFKIKYKSENLESEYDKMKRALDEDGLFPKFTIQSYIDTKKDVPYIMSFCIVETRELYTYIENNFNNISKRKTFSNKGKPNESEEDFLVVSFQELQNKIIYTLKDGLKHLGTMTKYKTSHQEEDNKTVCKEIKLDF